MRNYKRFLSALCVVLLGAGTFIGATGEIQVASNSLEEEITFDRFSRSKSIYVWYEDAAYKDYLTKAAAYYGEQYDAHVLPVFFEGDDLLDAAYMASTEQTFYPDVILLGHDHLEKAYLSGMASDISASGKVCNQVFFPETAAHAVTYKGHLTAYPLSFDTGALLYNKTYLHIWAQQQAGTYLETCLLAGTIENAEEEVLPETAENAEGAIEGEESELPSVGDIFLETRGLEAKDIASFDENHREEFLRELTDAYEKEALPRTLDDILGMADTFDAPQGVEGVMTWDVSDIRYNFWLAGNTFDLGSATGDDAEALSVYSPASTEALQAYQDLCQFFSIESDTVSYESCLDDFMAGKYVFTVCSTDAVDQLEKAKEEGTMTFDYGIALLPGRDDKEMGRSLSTTMTVCVNSFSAEKDLANDFAAYLTMECAHELYAYTGKMPLYRFAIPEGEEFAMFEMQYENSTLLPKMMETQSVWMELEAVFAKIWNGADVDETLLALDETLDARFNE